MTAKKYLLQIQDMRTKIENKKERLERIAGILTSPAVGELKDDKVQSSIELDKQERMIAEKNILEEELQRLMYEEATLIIKIGKQIDNMEDPVHARLLHLRYEECISFSAIAKIICYTKGSVYNKHGKALNAFERKYLRGSD